VDFNRRHPGDHRELVHLPRARPAGLRQVLGAHFDGELGAVRHHHLAIAIEDVAARGLHADLADPVVVRLGPVLVAGEDLDVPEP
jgi:hypothetical protein